MEIFIALLLEGKAKERHTSLVETIHNEFGAVYPWKRRPPSHITLKAPFLSTDLQGVCNLVEKIAKQCHPVQYQLNGIGSFGERVLFWDVEAPYSLQVIRKKLLSGLKKLQGIEFKPGEFKNAHFHATFANNLKEKKLFFTIHQFLEKEDLPKIPGWANHFAILVIDPKTKQWKTEKIIKFSGGFPKSDSSL